MESIISIGFNCFGIYLILGLLFSIAFLILGINKVDEGSKNTSFFFKLLLVPGMIFLWPVMLMKWNKSKIL